MSLIPLAACIAAAAAAWLVVFICERKAVPLATTFMLAIFAALFVFAFGPSLVGG